MLHILWIILKILLYIAGGLLALLLLALLSVLFCPICYKGQGEKKPETAFLGSFQISWLFGGVSLSGVYENEKQQMTIKILGVSLKRLQKLIAGIVKFKQRLLGTSKRPREIEEKLKKDNSETKVGSFDSPLVPPGKPISSKVQIPYGGADEKEADSKGFFLKLRNRLKICFQKLLRGIRFLWNLPGKIFGFFRNIALTFQQFCAKINEWKEFLEREDTRMALSFLWGKLLKLLKHIFPNRIRGQIIFGMENPAVTGQLLGVIGATCGLHKNTVSVTPVFDQKILEGHLSVKGRIYLFVLLKLAVQAYFNKDVKAMIKSYKQMEG